MLDNGHPLTTEKSALRDIVLPPSLLSKILSVAGMSGLAKAGSNPFASPIPWRKLGIKYNTNEIYFDLVEDLRAVVSKFAFFLASRAVPGYSQMFQKRYRSFKSGMGHDRSWLPSLGYVKALAFTSVAYTRFIGTPDLLLTFVDPKVLHDCSFHQCVRLA